jgi:hypothetical protein
VTGRGAAVGAGAPAAVAAGAGAAGAGVLDGAAAGTLLGVGVGAGVAVRVGADEAEGDELGREYELDLCDDWTAEMVANPPKARSATATSAVNRCFIFWVTYLLGT